MAKYGVFFAYIGLDIIAYNVLSYTTVNLNKKRKVLIMLKLKVCLTTFEVTVVPCFREYPSNGQHYQLPGNVLVEIPEIKVYDTIIKLYHPTTEAGTGHVDLYIKDIPSGLGIYDHSWTEVHPIDLSSSRIYLWPTGVKSLLKAILALDGFLLKNHGLRLTIQRITLAKFGIGVRKTIPT